MCCDDEMCYDQFGGAREALSQRHCLLTPLSQPSVAEAKEYL
jgi:hypothetical protein